MKLSAFIIIQLILLLSTYSLFFTFSSTLASVIGIDYGTEWLKVSIVKPGVPLDIVLNKESKRKTFSIVTIRDGIRHFGSDAVSLSTKVPQHTFQSLKTLLGKSFDDPMSVQYRNLFSNGMIKDTSRGTCAFELEENAKDPFTVEELVAMQLAHAKAQAEKYGNEPVTGAVITVPPYFNHFERQALFDAAELAGLRVFQLMNDETAVALNYAMTRSFDEPQYHIFYDMGAGSTVAILVKFYNEVIQEKRSNRTVPTLEVKSMGYDPTLGGSSIDTKVAEYLATEFAKEYKNKLTSDPKENPKSMAKFLKEATRVKQILSANTVTFASIENVMEDLDFKLKVTRTELEELCADIFARVEGPIKDILSRSSLELKDVNSLVLVGGGVRIPKVQEVLKILAGESKIAKNVNGDEAAVLGAGFLAAGISKLFRVREIKVQDINNSPVQVVYHDDTDKEVKATIFSDKLRLGAKKNMVFKKKTDFDFKVQYKSDEKMTLINAKVVGLEEVIKTRESEFPNPPKVKSLMQVTESGMYEILSAQAIFETEEEASIGSLTDTVMSFFGGGKKKEDAKKDNSDSSTENTDQVDDKNSEKKDATDSTTNSTSSENDKIKTADASEKPKTKTQIVQLTITVSPGDLSPMSNDTKNDVLVRLKKMDKEDHSRYAREEARNNLESYLYASKELLYDDNFERVTKDEERSVLKEKLEEVSDWLDLEAETAKKDEFLTHHESVMKIRDVYDNRLNEFKNRDGKIAQLESTIVKFQEFIKNFEKNLTASAAAEAKAAENASKESSDDTASADINNATDSKSSSANKTDSTKKTKIRDDYEPLFTLSELEAELNKTVAAKTWLDERIAEQKKLAENVDPVLTIKDLEEKERKLVMEFTKMLTKKPKKKKLKKVVPKKTDTPKPDETSEKKKSDDEDGDEQDVTNQKSDQKTDGDEESSKEEEAKESPVSEDEKKEDESPEHDEL